MRFPCCRRTLLLGTATLASLAGCAVGPDYHRPATPAAAAWEPSAPWREALPNDAALKGDWWKVFDDSELDPLVERALANNQDLQVAAARLDQARDQVTVARSALYPNVTLGASGARAKTSADRPLSEYGEANYSTVQNDFLTGPAVTYELDLFGRIRREVEDARVSAQQAGADFENTRLVLVAQLASDYFSLRELDDEIDVLHRSLDLERDALDFVTARHDLGFATGLDVAQQEALLESSAAQLELLQVQRAQNEHAIATLIGTPAPEFHMSPNVSRTPPPLLPVGLPSDLLQRRPDVASAERAMAGANARIGVAKAAYFPTLDLMPFVPGIGWQSNTLSTLFNAPSRLWSLGVSASQTLFDAGKTPANVRIARADYTAAVAAYRQTVLRAMEEVENGITGLDSLERAAKQADASVTSARRAYDIASDRYKGGVDTHLDVITAEQALLSDERQAVQIHGQQYATTVYLIKALGGGWQAPNSTAFTN